MSNHYQEYKFKDLIDIDLLSQVKKVGEKRDYQKELIDLIDDCPTILQTMSDKDLFTSLIQAVSNGFNGLAFENEIIYRFSFDFDKQFLKSIDPDFSIYILDAFLSVKNELLQAEEIKPFLNHFIDLIEPKEFLKNPKSDYFNSRITKISEETFKFIVSSKKEYLIGENNDNWWHSAALYERLDWCQWLKQNSYPYLINNEGVTALELNLRNFNFLDKPQKSLYEFLLKEEIAYIGYEKFPLYMNKATSSLNLPLFDLLMDYGYHIHHKEFNVDELKEDFAKALALHVVKSTITSTNQEKINQTIDKKIVLAEKLFLEQNLDNQVKKQKVKI